MRSFLLHPSERGVFSAPAQLEDGVEYLFKKTNKQMIRVKL